MAYAAKRNPNRCPTHPGALLREDMIPAVQRTVAEMAELLGISRQHLYDILKERKRVTPDVAARLGRLFGDGPGIWLRREGGGELTNAGQGSRCGLSRLIRRRMLTIRSEL
jgi:antitoxin HigA-1